MRYSKIKTVPIKLSEKDKQRFLGMFRVGDGCWEWMRHKTRLGYGKFMTSGEPQKAFMVHRVSYTIFNGPIPDGLALDHLCRNPKCVRPDHLEAVTNGENSIRGVGMVAINARKTHCWRGHEFTPENTYNYEGRQRHCRACVRTRYALRKRTGATR